jgi:hypothetical protein
MNEVNRKPEFKEEKHNIDMIYNSIKNSIDIQKIRK